MAITITQLTSFLAVIKGGSVTAAVEVGQGQSRDVEALMTKAGLTVNLTGIRADLAGISRTVLGRKKPIESRSEA